MMLPCRRQPPAQGKPRWQRAAHQLCRPNHHDVLMNLAQNCIPDTRSVYLTCNGRATCHEMQSQTLFFVVFVDNGGEGNMQSFPHPFHQNLRDSQLRTGPSSPEPTLRTMPSIALWRFGSRAVEAVCQGGEGRMVRLVLAGSDVGDLGRAQDILSARGLQVTVYERESQLLQMLEESAMPGLATVIIAQQVSFTLSRRVAKLLPRLEL